MIDTKKEFTDLLNNLVNNTKDRSLIDIYVDVFDRCSEKYGNNTIVFMEVGSFYEIYCPYESGILYEHLKFISNLLDIQLTRRNSKIKEIDIKNPYLLGFNNVSKSKYIQKLLNTEKYTIVIVSQKGNSKEDNVERYVETIISSGTNIDKSRDYENYILSLNIDNVDDVFITGFSYIDISTGKSVTGEFYGNKEDKNKSLDSIIDNLLYYKLSHIIINLLDKSIDESTVLNYLELNTKSHTFKREKRKLEYQNTLLSKIFTINSFVSPVEQLGLERLPLALESYIFLLEYIIDFEEKLLKDISLPIIMNDNQLVYIGNNGMEQLNVISNDGTTNLLDLLNKCHTAFGKRLFKERLLNPIKDKKELERRYSLIESFKDTYKEIGVSLQSICDIEKMIRKIEINHLHPYELYNLYYSLEEILKQENLLPENDRNKIKHSVHDLIETLKKTFLINDCQRFNVETISENILKKGIYNELDTKQIQKETIENTIKEISEKINKHFNTKEFVTINYNERDGFYFLITKSRFKSLESEMEKIWFKIGEKTLFLNEFKVDKRASNIKLHHEILKELSDDYLVLNTAIIYTNKNYFQIKINFLFKDYIELLKNITLYIADIDVAVTNLKNSIHFHYTKPIIVSKNEQYIEVKELRHPIIEQKLIDTKYISNDIIIGRTENSSVLKEWETNTSYINGILLFGLNSSGKSSVKKSLGLALIMAQAGMFVPAETFTFTLYDSLFTRIISKDNPDRGLSTFAVEMMELKNILLRGNNKSLVLGDEICHGTETISGVSIVAAAIKTLSEKKINFVFATHLHQLVELEDIKNIDDLLMLHLSVIRDGEKLIYDRKLKSGSGSSVYGLEFAKSLNMDKTFINYANTILNKIDKNDTNELLELKNSKPNKYNSKLFETRCCICNQKADDTHHIVEQQTADENNLIKNGIHKNHKSNLIPLCKKHHQMTHDGKLIISGFRTTNKGVELDYIVLD